MRCGLEWGRIESITNRSNDPKSLLCPRGKTSEVPPDPIFNAEISIGNSGALINIDHSMFTSQGSGCKVNVNSIIKKGQNREFFIYPILTVNPNNKSKHFKTIQKNLALITLARQARGHWFESSIAHIVIQGVRISNW